MTALEAPRFEDYEITYLNSPQSFRLLGQRVDCQRQPIRKPDKAWVSRSCQGALVCQADVVHASVP